jgi:hypothetical protein
MNPTAHVEPHEEPGPPPRRHLTADGRWIVFWAIVIPAALLLLVLWFSQSRFGPVGW